MGATRGFLERFDLRAPVLWLGERWEGCQLICRQCNLVLFVSFYASGGEEREGEGGKESVDQTWRAVQGYYHA